jgi:hypothetical protein
VEEVLLMSKVQELGGPAPPPNAVGWRATPNGRYYNYEEKVGEDVQERRRDGVVVYAQTFYYAQQKACALLRLASEHIDIELEEEK